MTKNEELAAHIYANWCGWLASADRSKERYRINFDELFVAMKTAKVTFDTAHLFLQLARNEHYPSNAVAKWTYKSAGIKQSAGISEQEFVQNWKKLIDNEASASFYDTYEVGAQYGIKQPLVPSNGGMNSEEHSRVKKYLSQFTLIDTTNLEAIEEKLQSKVEDMEKDLLKVIEDMEKDGSDGR